MSAIASFYLLDVADGEALLSATQFVRNPKKLLGIISRQTLDYKELFWQTLRTKAIELQKFEHTGWAFMHLITLYPDIANTESNIGDQLSDAMHSTWLSFTERDVRKSLELLGNKGPSVETLRQYFEDEQTGENVDDWQCSIQAAWDILRKWLSQVHDNRIGLLSIG